MTAGTQSSRVLLVVPISDLKVSALNARAKRPEDDTQKELDKSVKQNGILQPLLVREAGKHYEVLAGARRLDAAVAAGLTEVPCYCLDPGEAIDRYAREVSIIENLLRRDMDPLEEAKAIWAVLDTGVTAEAVSKRLGKSLGYVSRRAHLAVKLSAEWIKALSPKGRARQWGGELLEVVALLHDCDQNEVLDRFRGIPSLRTLKVEVANRLRTLKAAPWNLGDTMLDPQAGSCDACSKQSGNAPGLFEGLELLREGRKRGDATCQDSACWMGKISKWRNQSLEKARAEHGAKLLMLRGHWDPNLEPRKPSNVKNLVSSYSYTRVKKGTKGARPGFVYEGAGTGRVLWIKTGTFGSTKKATAGKAKPEKGTREYLSARREVLKTRRFAWEVDDVRAMVEKATLADVLKHKPKDVDATQHLLHLAAVYLADSGMGPKQRAKALASDLAPSPIIWEALQEEIENRLARSAQSHVPSMNQEAIELAGLLGRSREDLAKAAAEAITEPKSVAALAARLKGGKKKAAKKKAAKRPAKKKVAAKKRVVRKATKKKARP